jgi:hypothetical protein
MSDSKENVLVMRANTGNRTLQVVYNEYILKSISEGIRIKDRNDKDIISIESFFGLYNYDKYKNITIAVKYPIDVFDIRTILTFFRVQKIQDVSIELKEMKFSDIVMENEQKVDEDNNGKRIEISDIDIINELSDDLPKQPKESEKQPATNLLQKQDEVKQPEQQTDLELKEEKSTEPLSGCDLCKSIKNINVYKDTKTKSVLCDKCGKLADISGGVLQKKLNEQLITTDPDIVKGVIESIALDIMNNNTYRCYTTFRGMREKVSFYLTGNFISQLQRDYMMAVINIQENLFFTRLNEIINNMEYSDLQVKTKIQIKTVSNFIGAINSITSTLEQLDKYYLSVGFKSGDQLPTKNKLSDDANLLNRMKGVILSEYDKILGVKGDINDFKSILYNIQTKDLLNQFSFEASEFIGVLVKYGVQNIDNYNKASEPENKGFSGRLKKLFKNK